MMLTFWSSRVQTERGQTNTATSAQLALSEVHSLLPHPCDHPWSCKHKNPQKQQPRNKCPFQAQIGCSQGVSNMAKTEIGKIKQHGTGSQNFHLRTSGLSCWESYVPYNQELIVVNIWSYLIHILNKRKDSPLTLTPCIIMGGSQDLNSCKGRDEIPKGNITGQWFED